MVFAVVNKQATVRDLLDAYTLFCCAEAASVCATGRTLNYKVNVGHFEHWCLWIKFVKQKRISIGIFNLTFLSFSQQAMAFFHGRWLEDESVILSVKGIHNHTTCQRRPNIFGCVSFFCMDKWFGCKLATIALRTQSRGYIWWRTRFRMTVAVFSFQ